MKLGVELHELDSQDRNFGDMLGLDPLASVSWWGRRVWEWLIGSRERAYRLPVLQERLSCFSSTCWSFVRLLQSLLRMT